MAKGRKKDPTIKLKQRGSWRADTRPNEPQVEPGIPICPSFLGPDGKKEWRYMIKRLAQAGMMTELDKTALALYCAAWQEYLDADALVNDCHIAGRTRGHELVQINDKGNGYVNPAVKVRQDAWKRLVVALREFGMTPSARSSVTVLPSDQPKDDKGRFFNKSKSG